MDATLSLDGVAYPVGQFDLQHVVGRPGDAEITVTVPDATDPDAWLGAPAALWFGGDREGASPPGAFAGVVTEVEVGWAARTGGENRREVSLRLQSSLALLALTVDHRMFRRQDVKGIVSQLLEEHGLGPERQSWSLAGSYPERDYVVMWGESALDFITRLCELEGIVFWSDRDDDGEVVVFSDRTTGAEALSGGPLAVRATEGLDEGTDQLVRLTAHGAVRAGTVTQRDASFLTPALDVEATVAADRDTEIERYSFGDGGDDPARVQQLAQVALEAHRADAYVVAGGGCCARLTPGRIVIIVGADERDGTYFCRSVVHRFSGDGDGRSLVTEATFVPQDMPYRLPAVTPRPRIDGAVAAVVGAAEGAEPETIHTDEHGRAKVRFVWDRREAPPDDASCWMRVTQPQTSGSLMLPRVGWEVTVTHEHGDPDRPMITGRLYNGASPPPYALPEGKTRSALQTASSPGGQGRNEIRFEDAAGAEEIRIEAQKGHTLATAGDKSTEIGNQYKQEVGGTRTLDVGGDQSIKVTGGMLTGVTGSQTVTIGGSRTESINAARTVQSGAIAMSVGGDQTGMIGNPLEGAIALGAAMAKEAAEEAAAEAFEALDAAAAQAVDQVMAPVTGLQEQAAQMTGMVGQMAMPGGAMGGGGGGGLPSLPTPPVPSPSAMIQSAMGDHLPQGFGGGDGGGSSEANEAGPAAAVGATGGADNDDGPGHFILAAAASHSEDIGGMRFAVTAGETTITTSGDRSVSAGAAIADLVAGNRVSSCASKTESAVGLVVMAGGGESEEIGGARTTKVGGAIVDKVTGDAEVTAGGSIKMAAAYLRIKASSSIKLECGGSSVEISGGGVVISAPLIQIAGATIKQPGTVAEGS
ncbi:MAG: type VI secretion system tip protein TssI/VgrG [Myxococcota bacterium]